MGHEQTKCDADSINHISDGMYREHEIIVYKCNDCANFVIDVRSDNYEGDMLAGYITSDLVQGMYDAFMAVDKHEADKLLLLHIPF